MSTTNDFEEKILRKFCTAILGLVLLSTGYIFYYYFIGHGAKLEQRAYYGSANDKYELAKFYYDNYNTHYRCPKIIMLDNMCIMSLDLLNHKLFSSEQRAGYWLEKALAQDKFHAKSLKLLAQLYLGAPKIGLAHNQYYTTKSFLPYENYYIVLNLLKKSVLSESDNEAYHLLGWLHLRGLGTVPNRWIAKSYLSKSARNGYLPSQLLLAQEFGNTF